MRTLKELYQILYDNFDMLEKSNWFGLCFFLNHLNYLDLISNEELKILDEDFQKRKPTIFSKFWWSKEYTPLKAFWWKNTSAGNAQRKLFIKTIIDKL